MNRYINYLVVLSTILWLVLFIFPTLKATSDGANFMSKYEEILMVSMVVIVTFIQLRLFSIATMQPIQSGIFGILFIMMISSSTSSGEVGIISWKIIFSLIFWGIIITLFVIALSKWISRVKILYSQWKSRNSWLL
jgi:hypothetical protein